MNRPDDILKYLNENRTELMAFLKSLVTIETPSSDPATHSAALDLLEQAFCDIHYHTRRLAGSVSGGQLFARPANRTHHQPIQLLVGHVDTVWPTGTLDHMPFHEHDGKIHGPGIFDMKAGLTQMLFALRTLRAIGAETTVTPVAFINTDEEIGSRESTRQIVRLARIANRAFVLEPSLGPEGRLKTTRKGVGRFEIHVKGKAAHAGLNPESGASAILELSHQIQLLFAMNNPAKGITVNVGTIDGGLGANVVAPESVAKVDVRVPTQADAEHIEQAIHALTPATEGTEVFVTGGIGRPPMEASPGGQALWERAQSAAERLKIELEHGTAGGGSDGNTTSQFTPTLDGLGAVGEGAHAQHEHVRHDKLIERTALLALLLLEPPLKS